jgi:arginine-tRNA-protein transferase
MQLPTFPEHACSYLPDRTARDRAFWADRLDLELYHDFMDCGFRRSGKVIYQPACRGCRECRPIRISVKRFLPTKSQRRCLRRNADLAVSVATAVASDEKFDLYVRYMRDWHGRQDVESRSDFESFLYDSPVMTVDMSYRDPSGRLLAVGICDVCTRSLSSVYFFFDPSEAQRGLGTFGALREMDFAQSRGVPYYYLGYFVAGCASMSYKAALGPNEMLDTDGVWRESPRRAARSAV